MKLPERIKIQLRCSDDADLSDIIVLLKVRAGRKNPYFIDFPKTDAVGGAHISNSDFVGQFEDHWERGLMDYNGSVENADPRVEVFLFDVRRYRADRPSAMIWPLTAHERARWISRDERYRYYVSCRNDLFLAEPIIVDLERNDSISSNLETPMRGPSNICEADCGLRLLRDSFSACRSGHIWWRKSYL